MLRKAQRDEDVVALFQPRARPRLAALQPDAQVGGQPQRRVRVRVVVGARNGFPIASWPSTPSSRWPGGSRTTARSPSPARPCRSRSARCAAGCARRPSPSVRGDASLTASRCRAMGPSPWCRGRSSSRCGSARWSPGSGCPAGNAWRTGPRRRTGSAGSARRHDPGLPRTRWANRAVARTAIPPIHSRRSGRCSRSRTGRRSRRSAETGSANCSTRAAPGRSR